MSKIRFLSIGLSALALIWLIHFATNLRQSGGIKGHTLLAPEGPSALVRSLRPNYPYSIIAGGAYTPSELKLAHTHDIVVRAHYADFDVAHAQLVKLTDDRYQYVSYRIKDQVYWTKKKLRIPKGELLLTDGASYARARCGNRLSDTPHSAAVNPQPDPDALSLPPVTQQTLPQMSLANPPALNRIPDSAGLPIETQTGAVSPSDLTPSQISSQPVLPIEPSATGFYPSFPSAPGVPVVAKQGGSPAAPVNTTPISPSGPGTPVTTVTPLPTPVPVVTQPPTTTTPVPEPTSIHLFLLSLVISAFALLKMTKSAKREP